MKKLIILLLVMLFPSMVFASSITKEDIESSIEKLYPESTYTVTDNAITIELDNESVNISYEMDENYITFTNLITLSNGMSFENFKGKVDSLSNVLLGYMIVADIKGVETEKIGNYVFYILLDSLGKALNSSSANDAILIVDDDVDVSDGREYIRKSDFPNQVLYYTKKTYTDSEYRDNTDDMINSMLITTSLTNETSNSIDMIETIKVDLNADFQKLNQFEDVSTLFDDNINNQNDVNNLITENYENLDNSNNSSNDNDTLPAPEVNNPKTGINTYTILVGISIISLIGYIFTRKIKLFKKLG